MFGGDIRVPAIFCVALIWSVLKGFIGATVATCICAFGNGGVAIWNLFPLLYLVEKTVSQTSILGPNLKAILLVLGPVMICIWFDLVVYVSISFSFIYGFGYAVVTTMRHFLGTERGRWKHVELGGLVASCKKVVQDFSEFCTHSMPDYCEHFLNAPQEQPFDLSPFAIFMQLTNITLIICFNSIACMILTAARIPGLLARLCRVTGRLRCDLNWRTRIPLTLSVISFMPAAAAASVGISGLAGAGLGLFAGIVGAGEQSWRQGWCSALSQLASYDAALNRFCFGFELTCIPDSFCPEGAMCGGTGMRGNSPRRSDARHSLGMAAVWVVEQVGRPLLRLGPADRAHGKRGRPLLAGSSGFVLRDALLLRHRRRARECFSAWRRLAQLARARCLDVAQPPIIQLNSSSHVDAHGDRAVLHPARPTQPCELSVSHQTLSQTLASGHLEAAPVTSELAHSSEMDRLHPLCSFPLRPDGIKSARRRAALLLNPAALPSPRTPSTASSSSSAPLSVSSMTPPLPPRLLGALTRARVLLHSVPSSPASPTLPEEAAEVPATTPLLTPMLSPPPRAQHPGSDAQAAPGALQQGRERCEDAPDENDPMGVPTRRQLFDATFPFSHLQPGTTSPFKATKAPLGARRVQRSQGPLPAPGESRPAGGVSPATLPAKETFLLPRNARS
ncbi:hypothetical protein CYMTET_45271 [Cymbomonas tetramitiformis]|uniref:Uncharacterized protein n=1 Tax=Cymbomonas tetramitiformis TaxID=36881 RepID=A0AAE0BYK5_9CHLO|nr:hypothetical protein CYMTET_45272 [Cymbomonas tetramitiformis]KAK3245144.1 hypothetical protein CYMTET_45271 [Cymbomonas tetramitiformis]